MSDDRWQQLWAMAVGERAGEPAVISVSPSYSDMATLQWPDGKSASLRWHDGSRAWRWLTPADLNPAVGATTGGAL
jgi:hypothetical protein